jgi:hypothetical protein
MSMKDNAVVVRDIAVEDSASVLVNAGLRVQVLGINEDSGTAKIYSPETSMTRIPLDFLSLDENSSS